MTAPDLNTSAESGPEAARKKRERPSVAGVERRGSRLSVAVLGAVVFFVIFIAAAGLQIRLISGQRNLDRIERRIEDAQVRQFDLRQQEAMLRSPVQISQIAANDLGMVHAAPPLMVAPPTRVLGTTEAQVPAAATPSAETATPAAETASPAGQPSQVAR